MKRRDYIAAYCFLACLSVISIVFTLWAGNPPWAPFRLGPLVPWFPWMVSPYLALAGMIGLSVKSRRAFVTSIAGAMVIGIVNIVLMVNLYLNQDHSGQLWLAVPLYELLACIPLVLIVLVIRRKATQETPNQAL